MANDTANASNVDPSQLIKFLDYGALGLAGLMLILVIVALASGNLTSAKERVLTRFMYVGSACFIAALAVQYFTPPASLKLRVVVLPHDAGSKNELEMPLIRINDDMMAKMAPRSYNLTQDASLSVDVTDAISQLQQVQRVSEARAQQARDAETETENLQKKVNSVQDRITSQEIASVKAQAALIEINKIISTIPNATGTCFGRQWNGPDPESNAAYAPRNESNTDEREVDYLTRIALDKASESLFFLRSASSRGIDAFAEPPLKP